MLGVDIVPTAKIAPHAVNVSSQWQAPAHGSCLSTHSRPPLAEDDGRSVHALPMAPNRAPSFQRLPDFPLHNLAERLTEVACPTEAGLRAG